jgi:hypothetical protein
MFGYSTHPAIGVPPLEFTSMYFLNIPPYLVDPASPVASAAQRPSLHWGGWPNQLPTSPASVGRWQTDPHPEPSSCPRWSDECIGVDKLKAKKTNKVHWKILEIVSKNICNIYNCNFRLVDVNHCYYYALTWNQAPFRIVNPYYPNRWIYCLPLGCIPGIVSGYWPLCWNILSFMSGLFLGL